MSKAAALLICAWCCGAADLYRVAGVVVDAGTGAPLPQACVAVQRTGTSAALSSQTTGSDGRFAFDLPQGKYELQGGTRTAMERYATTIVTGPDQKTDAMVFRWHPPGGISGRIVDEAGEPVEDALVQLTHSTVEAGKRVTRRFASARTDDRGEYRFGRLRGSTYYLMAAGRPWYSAGPALLRVNSGPAVAYAPVYYPNSLDKRGAAPIVLKPGEERRADFTLRTVPGTTIKVSYDAPAGLKGTVGLAIEGSEANGEDGFAVRENVMPVGQMLAGVAPGRYLLQVRGTRGTAAVEGRQWIDVSGAEMDVKLTIRPLPAVSGTVVFQNPAMKPRGSLVASLSEVDSGAVSTATMRADDTIAFGAVWPGKYRVNIECADGYFASQVRVEGAEFRNGVLELAGGMPVTLRIVASDETGRVQGFANGSLVVLASAAGENRGVQTNSDGSFEFAGVPVGEYFLFAVEDAELEYGRSDAIPEYLPAAKRVHVEAHGISNERLENVRLR